MSSGEIRDVLVVGGTGHLGCQVIRALAARGKRVRALVRPGSDGSIVEKAGASVARGDLMDAASLEAAVAGMGAVLTTAAGYMRRRKTDTPEIDKLGNRNLVNAAKGAGVKRFVFASILRCNEAADVPHMWNKKLIEDYVEHEGVPFVSLRPGAFIDQGFAAQADGLRKGRLLVFSRPSVRYTQILTADVARCMAEAVDSAGALGKRIDLGADRPVSGMEVAEILTSLLGRKVSPSPPAWLLTTMLAAGGLFDERARDFGKMLRYIATGRYVADTARQAELFGKVPSVEESLRRWVEGIGLLNTSR